MAILTKTIWGVDNPLVDELIDGEPRLVLRLEPAENAQGPTFSGLVGYGVGPETEALYGPAIMAAVIIVAVNLETGGCTWGSVAPALAMPAIAARPDNPPILKDEDDDGEAADAEVAGFDLLALIGLPRDGCRYAVFAWLDDLLSEITVIETPAGGDQPIKAKTSPLMVPQDIPAVIAHTPNFRKEGNVLILPPITKYPIAVLALDSARRHVTPSSWLRFPDFVNAVGLDGYISQLEFSNHTTRLVCFMGPTNVSSLVL